MRFERNRLPGHGRVRLLLASLGATLLCAFSGVGLAQTGSQMPERTGHVSDYTGVINENTRRELENILANLKLKTDIEFDIAVVDTTGGLDIFDYSSKLAQEWNIGSRTSPKKSLLLVVSVGGKTSFTRFSRSVQRHLPEGVLGEMSQRMRPHVDAGQFSVGLETGVQVFVTAVSNKLGLSADDFAKPVTTDSGATQSAAVQPTPEAQPSPEAVPVVTPEAVAAAPVPVAVATPEAERLAVRPRRSVTAVDDDAESEEVELTLTRPLQERVATLRKFLDSHPASKSRPRAIELLVSAQAGLGDEKLKNGDSAGGVEQLMKAISDAPQNPSEKLFSGVISQIPLNLYLRGERGAAVKAAQEIEAKFGSDPKHLLAMSGFYLGTEQGAEAIRVATQAVKIAPQMAEAHQALGLGLHISLRLDEAAAEYKRALELDPNSKGARRSLADLNRASGKAEEALVLYREQSTADPADKAARAGLVLSLLELGRKDEAKVEVDKALASDPRNLALLAGLAYWYAAHNELDSALTFGSKAIEVEPRYTWSYVAVARALTAQGKPIDAERAVRYARQYGKFPTLDYELASALASAGLYDEAADQLMQSFGLENNQLEARLAGSTPARSVNFIELLAPERKASIFQPTAADSEENARILKALLTFSAFMKQGNGSGPIDEERAVVAARQFAAGDDPLRVYRQLYAASQLLRRGIGFRAAFDLSDAARSTADAGLNIAAASLAVQAEEYRDIRARAIASGGTPEIAEAPRNLLSNLLRGRIEDLSGWALYHQDRLSEASDHLKRAVNILPEGTPAWRTALWHLGAALDGLNNKNEALVSYIKSYNAGDPDPVRRSIIEQLYRRINGSLAGLDDMIGAAPGTQPTTEPARSNLKADQGTERQTAPFTTNTKASSEVAPSPVQSTQPASTSPPSEATPPADATGTPATDSAPAAPPSDAAARPATVTVTGRVRDSQNNPLANVVVVLISAQGTVLASTTDDQGKYSFTVASSTRSYRVIPSKDGFTFEPADKVLPDVSENLKDLDFIGAAAPKP